MGWLHRHCVQSTAVPSEKRNKTTHFKNQCEEHSVSCCGQWHTALPAAGVVTSTAAPNKTQHFPPRTVSSSLCSPIVIHTERYHLPVLCACLCLITLSKMHIALFVWKHTICTDSLTFNNSTFCPHSCIYVFCVDLRTNWGNLLHGFHIAVNFCVSGKGDCGMTMSTGFAREGQAGENWQLSNKQTFLDYRRNIWQNSSHTILFSSVSETVRHSESETVRQTVRQLHCTVQTSQHWEVSPCEAVLKPETNMRRGALCLDTGIRRQLQQL